MQGLKFTRKPKQPFRLDLTSWVLRRLPRNTIDRFQNHEYGRATLLDGQIAEIVASQRRLLRGVQVSINGRDLTASAKKSANIVLDRVLGLDIDLSDFYKLFGNDPKIGNIIQEFKGFKPSRFPSVFEALVNAFTCQQISLNAGLTILNRPERVCAV